MGRAEVIEALRHSTGQFYLTGSRFFWPDDARPDGPYEFFIDVTDAPSLVVLHERGFTIVDHPEGVCDPAIIALYRHPSGVDVQVVAEALRKHRAQHAWIAIRTRHVGPYAPITRADWEWLYTVVDARDARDDKTCKTSHSC